MLADYKVFAVTKTAARLPAMRLVRLMPAALPEIALDGAQIIGQFVARHSQRNLAGFQHRTVIGDLQYRAGILLDK